MEQVILVSFILISILIAITLHEMMHAVTSYWLGDDTAKVMGRVSLNPLKHIDPITTVALPVILFLLDWPPIGAAKPVPFNPTRLKYGEYGMGLVAIAGPLTNLVLALIGAGIYHLFLAGSTGYFVDFIVIFAVFNVVFFAFNILPIPPLDGSRVLYVFSPDGIRDILNMLEKIGFIIIFALVFLAGGLLGKYIEAILNLFNLPGIN